MKTNLALTIYEKRTESTSSLDWNYLVSEITKVFRLSEQERKNFNTSVTAKIIATIPFEAKCNEPERTAIAHLCLYMTEKKGFQKYCAHLEEDDIHLLKRLEFISTFDGGNPLIIEHGMYILALVMLEGYYQSAKNDKINNVYNPISNGAWNYKKIKQEINLVLSKIKNETLDSLKNEVFALGMGW